MMDLQVAAGRRAAAVALALSQALMVGPVQAQDRVLVSASPVEDHAAQEATSAWRAYAKDGGGADLKRFTSIWEKTSGLRSGGLGQIESAAPPRPGSSGEAWPPRFDLICNGANEERISTSSSLGVWGHEAAPSDPPRDAKMSPPHPALFHIELILGLYCRDGCAFVQPLTSIDADNLVGRFESRNMEWVDTAELRWSRTTGTYSYVTQRRHKLASHEDVTVLERGTCRLGDPRTAQATH